MLSLHTALFADLESELCLGSTLKMHHEKTDLKVFVVVIPKEGWARVATPILLLV